MGFHTLRKRIKASFTGPEAKEQWAWCFYDFAKSAFESVLGVFLGPYMTYLAQKQSCLTTAPTCSWCEQAQYCINVFNSTLPVSCDKGSCWQETDACCTDGGEYVMLGTTPIAYGAFFSFITSAAVIFQVICLPVFGALGDVYNPKKFLIGSTVVACAALISIVGTNRPDLYWVVGLLSIIANVAYGITNVFYNASLIYVAEPDDRDNLSSRGFAVGYIGSVLFLVVCLIIYLKMPGIPTMALLCALTGVWWLVFAIIPFKFVQSTKPKGEEGGEVTDAPSANNIFLRATYKFGGALKILPKVPQTALFLAASALYNDGISTIGSQAAVYATYTVHAESQTLLLVVLEINILAIVGAFAFNLLAKVIATKWSIFVGIAIYMVVVIYAYFIRGTWELWIIGALIGLGLGGSQSLSRSLLACIIPPSYESEIFSFYEITQRGTSWIGPLVYGAFTTAYINNQRPAMLSMLIFLVVGGVMLLFVNVEKAKEQAAACGSGSESNSNSEVSLSDSR